MTRRRWAVVGAVGVVLSAVGVHAASATTPSPPAYVVSCVPTQAVLARPTLYPAGTNLQPPHYVGTVSGAKAFVKARGGRCWQTYYGSP